MRRALAQPLDDERRGRSALDSAVLLPLICNYIAMKCRNSGVYQYAVAFCPDVDSLRMRYQLMEKQRTRDIIGDVSVSCLPIDSLAVKTI